MIRSRGTVSSAIIVAFTAGTIGTALATEAPRSSSRPHLLVPRQGGHDHPTQVDTATTSVRTNGLEVRITLNAAGSRYVGTTVPIKGHLRGNTEGVRKRIVVQSKRDGVWRDRAQRFQRRLGVYRLPAQEITRPGTSRFRTVVWARGEMLDVSRVMSVRGVALPTQTPLPTLTPSPTPASMPTPTAEPTPLPTLTPSPTPTTTTTPTPEPTPTPTPTPEPTPTPTPTPEPTPTPTPTPEPESITEKRTIDGAITCEHLRVAVLHQERTSVWTWDPAAGRWVLSWTPWDTVSTTSREAAAADCVNVVERTSADVLLPDIRMKNLDACGASERELSGGSCFRIVNPAPANSSFPHLTGKKLLKFPVITLNVGMGPSELVADRSSPTSSTWRAYQTFLRPNGDRESVVLPGAEFYYAGDGHRHWHVRDFDDYSLLDADGETVRTAEKHGYCLQDNTRYTPMRGEPGVPEEPVYPDATQCGKGLPDALAVIHGMSKGWGDTYSSALPDQALDISGVPDGEYVVELTADANNHIRETNEENNTASIRVVITGDTVAMVPGSATGGLD